VKNVSNSGESGTSEEHLNRALLLLDSLDYMNYLQENIIQDKRGSFVYYHTCISLMP
jgi:hypothetical protein